MHKTLFLFMLFLLISCKSRNNISGTLNPKLENQKKFLYGKSIKSIAKIINDSIDYSWHFLFIYNGFDCESCIKKGYKLANTLDSLTKKQIVYVISTSANIGGDQLKYDYFQYVYNDEHDLIRSELKYIYTPVLLFFDSIQKIDNVHYLTYETNKKDESLFIDDCLKKRQFFNCNVR